MLRLSRHSKTILHKLMSAPNPPSTDPQPKIRRQGPQILSEELIGDELAAAQPKQGRLLTDDRDPWSHNAW